MARSGKPKCRGGAPWGEAWGEGYMYYVEGACAMPIAPCSRACGGALYLWGCVVPVGVDALPRIARRRSEDRHSDFEDADDEAAAPMSAIEVNVHRRGL